MVKIKSSSEQVYDYIVHEIEIGNYGSGKRLSEAEIMEIFGVSRTPIREALIRLAADGIIDNNSRKGFFVRHLERKDVWENYFIIACLDSYAAVLALDSITEKDIEKMETLELGMELAIERQNYELYHDEQNAFHKIYFDKCGNRNLVDLIMSLQQKYVRTSWFSQNEEDKFKWLAVVNEDHKRLIECFRDGDRQKLIDTVFAHWGSDRKRPEEYLEEEESCR